MDFFDDNGSQLVSGLVMVKAWVSRLRVMMWQTFKIVDSSYSCISLPKSYFQNAKTAAAFYQKSFQRYVPKILNHYGPLCNILETLVSTILTHFLAVRARTSLKDILQEAVRNQRFKTFTLIISNFVINDIRLRPMLYIKGNKAMVGVWLRVLAIIRSHTVTLPPTMTYVTHLEKFLSFKNSFFTIIFVVTKKRSSVEFIWFHIEIRSLRY